ncbi:MAG: hypothetical protein Ct9H90mP21_2560 [Methanobacteriota archaeon]|nr:MAG: hypothetical protein Ct9H90mP21_2560 [Euryarchaeota archaeon]
MMPSETSTSQDTLPQTPYETLDPFGSNPTDLDGWKPRGGPSFHREVNDRIRWGGDKIPGTERSAPSKVFDGERMYTGIRQNPTVCCPTIYRTGIGLEPPLLIKWLNFPEVPASMAIPNQRPGGNHSGEILDYNFQWE